MYCRILLRQIYDTEKDIRQKIQKSSLLFRSKICIVDIFLKRFINQQSQKISKPYYYVPLNGSLLKFFWNYTKVLFYLIANTDKRAASGVRQFVTTEHPLKIMKNCFYFTLKALFVFKIFELLSWLLCLMGKQLD